MFEYGTKGLLLSIGMREREVFKCWIRGSDARVGRKQLTGHAGPTRE